MPESLNRVQQNRGLTPDLLHSTRLEVLHARPVCNVGPGPRMTAARLERFRVMPTSFFRAVIGSAIAASIALIGTPWATGAQAIGICPPFLLRATETTVSRLGIDGIATGPTNASIRVVAAPGASSLVVQYGRGNNYTSCSTVARPTAARGQAGVDVLLRRLVPHSVYHFRIVANTAAGTAFGEDHVFRTLAGGHVPQGVELGSISIGGMTEDEVRSVLRGSVAGPLRLSYAGAFWTVSRTEVGARLDSSRFVTAALTAAPGAVLPPVEVSVDAAQLHAYVTSLDRRWSREGHAAGVHLVGKRAVITPLEGAVTVDKRKMAALIAARIRSGARGAIQLEVVKKSARPAPATAQKAVVVRLGSQTLTAYLNGKPVLRTPVTTGRPALPTPIGSYYIHFRASPYTFVSPWPPGSPYWYPPAPVTWAMYFYDNDFLHDDPAEPADDYGAGSEYGAYASHGCVHVPHSAMAFLYNWLPVGAPVIVSQS